MKDEDEPYYFSISALKKEPVCRRCHEKMEVVKRLKEAEVESGAHPSKQESEK